MKYLLYLTIILVAVFLFYYFGVFGRQQQSNNNQQTGKRANEISQKRWETKTDKQSSVTIRVTPVELGGDVKTWRFIVVFDTHSVNLDYNPIQIAVLMDDKGKTYRPISWEGSGPGGHHREGVLVFNTIDPIPTYLELKIKNVGGVPERTFKWNIK